MGIALKELTEGRREEIASLLFEVKSRDQAGELHGLCPIHGESNPSFSYNFRKDQYHCFSCGASGDLVRLYTEVKGLTQLEGFQSFCREFGIEAKKKERKGEKKKKGKPVEPEVPEEEWTRLAWLPEAWKQRLVETRGWTREIIKELDLCLWESADRKERRIAIPIWDDKGKLRNVRLYLPGLSQRKIISWGKGFGASRLFPPPGKWKEDPIWLVEGEPDCICALSKGLNAVTQTAGANTWKPEFNGWFRDRDVVIAYDADLKGWAGANKVARSLAGTAKQVRILIWPDWMGREDGQWPEDHGQDLTDFLVRHGRSLEDLQGLLASAKVFEEGDEAVGDARRFFIKGASGRSVSFKSNLLAREILEENDLVTDPATGIIYRWNGEYWQEFDPRQIRRIALQKLGIEATENRARDAASQVADLSVLDTGREMNPNPNLLCLKNGTLDLVSATVGPHDKDHLLTYQFPVSFELKKPELCPRWNRFLEETVQVDGIIRELQEFFGYCLTRSTKYHKALLLVGPGADGKSTCLNVLQALVGAENCSNVDLSVLDNEFHRASLHNKVLNVATEVEAQVMQSGYFKSIVSGDPINASFKHQPVFSFRPVCKMAFSTNRWPRVQDNSYGFFRRILPIQFRWQIPPEDRDPHLFDTLQQELSGIFAWALMGLVRLEGRGRFQSSPETELVLQRYKAANNPVVGFVDDCCTEEPMGIMATASVGKADLYGAYADYCKKYGFRALNQFHFAKELKGLMPKVREIRRNSGSDGRIRMWEGIRLVEKY